MHRTGIAQMALQATSYHSVNVSHLWTRGSISQGKALLDLHVIPFVLCRLRLVMGEL